MTDVVTLEEYARQTGRSLEDVEAMVAEAENGLITCDMLDPSTLRKFNWTEETEQRIRDLLAKAEQHV